MIYRKWGRVVRWENGTIVRVEEAGEAREEDGKFFAQPIAERVALPEVDAEGVIETARAIGKAERVIVAAGVAVHEYGGTRWEETTWRIHVALTRKPWRVLVDDADVAPVARALGNRYEGQREFGHLIVPRQFHELVHCAKEQLPGGLDGYGRPIEHCRVGNGEPPNFYRPSYRVRPVRKWMNVRAIPFGVMQAAPRVLALVDGGKALVEHEGRAFITSLRLARAIAANERGEMLL